MTDKTPPDPFSHEERQRTGRNAGLCIHPEGYDGECPCPTGCGCCKAEPAPPAPEPATITDPEWLRQQYAAAMVRVVEPFREIVRPEVFRIVDELATAVLNVRDRHVEQLRQRLELAAPDATHLRRLRDQLAAEHAKAVAADQHPRPDLDHLRVTPHNGIAAGLQTAIFFVDHHLREAAEAGEQA